MGHAFILIVLLAYRAFLGNLMVGVVPAGISKDIDVHKLYKLDYSFSTNKDNRIPKHIEMVAPVIDASAAMAVDLDNDQILFAKDAYKKRQIASLTKIMTALVVVDKINLNEEITITQDAASIVGSNMKLVPGEKISAKSLLYGMLIDSANDAAYALADYVSGSQEKFVEEMNKKARKFGLVNTKFSNSIGLDSVNNYSTAFEVYLMVKEFIKNPLLKKIVNIDEMVVKNINGGEHKLENTNKNLHSFLNITGIKTGTTDMAGKSVVNLLNADNGHRIIIILLNSPRRFSEARILGDWCLRAFDYNSRD